MRPITDEAKRQLVESTYRATAGNFPDVPDMAVSEAQRLLREGNIVLVDVRSPEEQAVSMIEGAITAAQFDGHRESHQGTTVVTYCTMGYRSGMFARRLVEQGWKAFNLEGAILGWTHAGGELVNADGPTMRVHVYSRKLDLLPEGYEAVW